MKVFISWSGGVSHRVAVALRDWLPYVLQSVDPYVSSEDIEKGARWSSEVGRELESTSYGILCVTRENLDSRWLNFEAGALSKSMDLSRVSPVLIDLRPADLVGPLEQFQATTLEIEDMLRLASSMNSACERPIDDSRLDDTVRTYWPRLEEAIQAAVTESANLRLEPQRDPNEMVQEVLEISRSIQRWLISAEGTDELSDISELSTSVSNASLVRLGYGYSRLSRREEVLQQVRNILNVYYIRDAVVGNVGQTALTVVFKELPREEVASTIKAITDYYGVNLYTFVAESAQLAVDDATELEPYDDQTERES